MSEGNAMENVEMVSPNHLIIDIDTGEKGGNKADDILGIGEFQKKMKSSASSAPSAFSRDAGGIASASNERTSAQGGEKDAESLLAEKISQSLINDLAFDEIANEWYQATRGKWEPVTERRAMKTILETLKEYMPDGFGISKLNNIKSFLMIYLLLEKWEGKKYLLPMKNGVLNVKTMELRPYSHSHRFNWQLPYDYEPEAKIDVIKRWLWDASGQDIEVVNVIRAFFKIALIGGEVQKFLEIVGPGGTGKSTLLRLLVAFIGKKNHAATDLKNLESNRFEAAALYGKRLALVSDSSRYGGEVSVLKALTGGDPVRLEKKNQQQGGSFVFDGVVVIASNEPIQSADYSSGLIRRRLPVMFNRKVTDADKEKWQSLGGIERAMMRELPGLLNWVLEMTDDDVKKAIGGINGEMTQAQRQHLIETNKLASWIDDNCIIKADSVLYIGKSTKADNGSIDSKLAIGEKLYSNYEAWCIDNGVNALALQRFTSNLIDLCEQLKLTVKELNRDKNGKRIQGLAIRSDIHFKYLTPITKKSLDAEECAGNAEVVLKKGRGSVGLAEDAEENSDIRFSNMELF